MSDQQQTGAAITSLEEVFLSREFGRAPSRGTHRVGGAEEASNPTQLEEVFLSSEFGRPHAVAPAPEPGHLPQLVPLGVPAWERETARYRAIAAVSGVAAAALAIAGIASGTGQPARPTVSARGPGAGSRPFGQNGGRPSTSSGSTPGLPSIPAPATAVAAAGGGAAVPIVPAGSSSGSEAAVEAPPGTTVAVVPSPQAPSGAGGTAGAPAPGSPTGPAPTGSGNPLSPVLVLVGDTVTTVGAAVTTMSDQLGAALPVVSPVTGALGDLGMTVASLGHGVTGAAV